MDQTLSDNQIFQQGISIKAMFPNDWSRLKSGALENNEMMINVNQDHFPFLVAKRNIVIQDLVVALPYNDLDPDDIVANIGTIDISSTAFTPARSEDLSTHLTPGTPAMHLTQMEDLELGQWSIKVSDSIVEKLDSDIRNLVLIVHYQAKPALREVK